MKTMHQEPTLPAGADISGGYHPPVETAATILEARLELAGRRVAAYLRHLPLPERSRHELALKTLTRLAEDPGINPSQAEGRAMAILRELLEGQSVALFAVPGPFLRRMHMKPEEMDRRPWVRTLLRFWHPMWSMTAVFFNTRLIDFFLYALMLAGLFCLDLKLP